MTIEQKLQEYILNNYKSIMQFAKVADIPYTTVKGIFSRGIWGTSIQNITRICNVLSIDIYALIDGEIKPKTNVKDLTNHENKVITAYRNKPEMQPAVDKILEIEPNYETVLMAARSKDNKPVSYIEIPKSKLDLFDSVTPVTNEEDI